MAMSHETPLATPLSQDDEYESVLGKSTALLQLLHKKRALGTAAVLAAKTAPATRASLTTNETVVHTTSHHMHTDADAAGSLQEAKDVLFHHLCELYTLLHVVYS